MFIATYFIYRSIQCSINCIVININDFINIIFKKIKIQDQNNWESITCNSVAHKLLY